MLQYHHSRSLEHVVYGIVTQSRNQTNCELGAEFEAAYRWLENEVGFYPLFLSAGTTEEDIRMTGYQNQWRRILSEGPNGKEYRKKGNFPNDVLFSFGDIDGVFMDYDYWDVALNASHKDYRMTNHEKRLIFKPSWPKSKWLGKARNDQHSVQLVTPELYLPDAKRIRVRNKSTKSFLETMGFNDVEVKRIKVEH